MTELATKDILKNAVLPDVTSTVWYIQDDSGGICTTLGNDSMSDSKQKSS
jgi:hypothetical protein